MSSSSGAKVSQDCIETYQNLKLRKQLKYIIYKLDQNMCEIVVDKSSDAAGLSGEEAHEKFIADLPEDGCRYVVYDFEYELGGGEGKRNKIFFVSWSSDNAKIREKMVYASSKDALKRALVGFAVEIQAADFSDVAHVAFLEKVGVKSSKN